MDQMSLFSIFSTSLPEAVFDVFLGMLIVGEKDRFRLEKTSIISYMMAVFLFCLSAVAIRRIIPVSLITLFIVTMLYAVIYKAIYRVNFLKAVTGALFVTSLIVTIESFYFPPYVAFVNSLKSILTDDITRLLISVPERVIQFTIILILWNSKNIFINMARFSKIKTFAIITIFCNLSIQAILWYVLLNIIKNVILTVFLLVATTLSIVAIIFTFKIITSFTKTIRLERLSNNESNNIISYIEKCMDKNSNFKKTG